MHGKPTRCSTHALRFIKWDDVRRLPQRTYYPYRKSLYDAAEAGTVWLAIAEPSLTIRVGLILPPQGSSALMIIPADGFSPESDIVLDPHQPEDFDAEWQGGYDLKALRRAAKRTYAIVPRSEQASGEADRYYADVVAETLALGGITIVVETTDAKVFDWRSALGRRMKVLHGSPSGRWTNKAAGGGRGT